MENKVVLITGASRGIGAAIARTYASHGYAVILNYCHRRDETIIVSQEIESTYHVPTLVIQSDVSNEQEVVTMVQKSIQRFGHIDVLVNNAGIAIDTLFQDKTVENFKKILDVNLIGTFLVSKYVGEEMFQRKQGKIINISSTNGLGMGYPMSLDYDASKAAILSLTKNLCIQYAPYIQVNAVVPGWIATENEMEDIDLEYLHLEEEKIALKRIGQPSEVANVVYFLGTENASYINGTMIRIDGGTL